jgi:DNA mismatch repair protein PMS2
LSFLAEVRFKNQGLDSIEVQDNGCGITPENYKTIALKHHTSKLSTYSDLTTLQTFGFRGEALSSLCALSHFAITTCLASDAPKGTKLDFEISGKLKGTSVVAAQKGTTVLVENLFQNLPVRRRELERNIKREWNRVVSLLGQYACIQTGVKISATQQASKGKKTTLFSTKGNPSTRENIVNVFGAKTLTALLALDLKLELEPTNGPSQRLSTKEDGSTKEVRIVGHISRPAFGEGRQTPDRQMFFVNARPCSLPQVAKAFNEVYKSYNSIQSPFIFANIEINTHLYDVNVSPDKRTILLHDQASMLEHLKTSLTELFESQDYTVPISQLPAQKQSAYRQLTITRPNAISKDTSTSHASTESTETEERPENRSRSVSTDHEEGPRKDRNPQVRQNAVSRDSVNRGREAVSLISDWLGRETEERGVQKEANARSVGEKADGLSKEKLRLVEKLGKENNQEVTASDPSGESDSSVDDLPPAIGKSRQVLDFNQRIAELGPRNAGRAEVAPVQNEGPIPAITTPARRSVPSAKGLSSGSAQPFRSPVTMATITIGDHTVTSSIGSPSPKRPRIEKFVKSDGPSPLPSFGSRLTRRFTASGTAQNTEQSGDSGDEDINESESSPVRGEDRPVTTELVEDPREEENVGIEVPVHGSPLHNPEEDLDADYIDEDEKKALEEAKVLEMIRVAEEEASRPSDDNVKRARLLLKGSAKKKDSTLQLVHSIDTTVERIQANLHHLDQALSVYCTNKDEEEIAEENLDSENAEEKLSLTINKRDFEKMKIIGQFNLGFILASRTAPPANTESEEQHASDDLFIIDQHASDEKYNFERLQATTVVQSQRLVRPKTLDLTAMEEEIVIENRAALETNGFVVTVDESGDVPVGQRCQLISLPLSRETTFSLSDLEELLSLLSEHPAGSVPRPSKVRKMFAMRACRSSIMIGRTLTHNQMCKVVKHMGEIDKPWNCPHGRPTMRHLFKLGAWDEIAWKEGDSIDSERPGVTDWAGYVRQKRGFEA